MRLKVALKQKLVMGVMTIAMAVGMVSLSGVTAYAAPSTTPSGVCSLKKGDTTLYYPTIKEALDAGVGDSKNVITLRQDVSENIYIKDSITIDLAGHKLISTGLAENGTDFLENSKRLVGPVYIVTDDPNSLVVIKNGTVKAEIDGMPGFKENEVRYKGPVELEEITLEAQTDVGAALWTDGHPYTLKNCHFDKDGATVQNIKSDVNIDKGEYGNLNFYVDDDKYPGAFGIPHEEREFYIVSGTFDTPSGNPGVDDYIVEGSTKDEDKSDDNKTVVKPLGGTAINVPGDAVMTGNTGHSITIQTDPEVQYSLESATGPWYKIENGKLVRVDEPNVKTVLDAGVDPETGVSLTAPDKITFTKNYGVDPTKDLEKGKDYTIHSRYTKEAIAADPKKTDTVAKDTKLPTAPTDAKEVGELFVKGNGTTTSTGSGKDEKADNAKVEVTVSPDGKGYIAKLKEDINDGPIVIPDNYGDVTIDLNGHTIKGADGTADSPDGKDAIDVTKGTGKGTTLNIEDNSAGKGGQIIGGNAYEGSGGNGGDGVDIADGANGLVNIGKGVTISGGNGADSSEKNGGSGGVAVDGNVGKNDGTIKGGNGGNYTGSATDPSTGVSGSIGGNGGAGVDGNVTDNTGSIAGGNGGNGANGGGNAGNAVTGTVAGSGTVTAGTKGETIYVMSESEKIIYQNSESLVEVEKLITSANTDKGDVKGSKFSLLRLKAVGKKKAVKLTWKKQSDADGYILYANRCGKKLKKIKEINNKNATSYTDKKLKVGKYYKYSIVAYKNFGTERRVIARSITVHSTTDGGKYTNPTGVKIKSKKKLSLKKGKSSKVKATYTKKGAKRVQEHVAIIRYESTDKKVATVDKKGKIKAVGAGTCTIYVYAQNGFYKTIKVTVK